MKLILMIDGETLDQVKIPGPVNKFDLIDARVTSAIDDLKARYKRLLEVAEWEIYLVVGSGMNG